MGPTKVYRAQFTAPDSIRGRFGLSDTRNAVHGSGERDSQLLMLHTVLNLLPTVLNFYVMCPHSRFSDSSESAVREIGIFFPDFSIARWFHEEEAYFKTGTVKLCAQEFVHAVVSSS